MSFKKKSAVYSVAALMLCVAVYLNWSYNKTDDGEYSSAAEFENAKMLGEAALVDSSQETKETSGDYFAEARLSRQQARDEAVSILNETIEKSETDSQASTEASAQIQVMAQSAEEEARIESIIIAKGYEDCVVFVNDTGVNVIVAKPEGGLTDSDVAKITEIVTEESGMDPSQVTIIETE